MVQFAFYVCRRSIRGKDIKYAVEKLFAVDAFMQLTKWMEMQINCVRFVEH